MLYESKAHAILLKPKEQIRLDEERDKEVDNLVVKVMTEKFNKKYSSQLTDLQQLLIKEYVFNENTEGKAFKNVLKRIKETVLRDLSDYTAECDNTIVAKKINEVKEDIIFKDKIGRIRDIKIHKDTGKIFFLTDDGSLWKMEKK